MKKSLIALAVLAASASSAYAQSSVTLFGIIDQTLTYGRTSGTGGNHVTRLANSGYNSSRLGFRGVEDLGGGMSASFWLEGSLGTDDGTTGQRIPTGNQTAVHAPADGQGFVFNRRSTLSLAGGWGELRLGRDYTPEFWNTAVFDPFGDNGVGTTLTLIGPTGLGTAANALVPVSTRGTLVRAANSFGYFLPGKLGGFYGQAQYYLGENVSSAGATKNDGNGGGLRVGYANGPFDVAVGFGTTKFAKTATTGTYRSWNIGGAWNFGMAKLMGQYYRQERDSIVNVDGRGFLIGALIPVGAGEIRASWSEYKIDAGAGPDPRARQLAIGYVHNLSKRTALYTTYAHVRNRDGSALGANGATGVVNNNASGLDLGIRHSF